MDLVFSQLFGSLSLVQPLQGAVVAFIQAPVTDCRCPHGIHFIQDNPQGPDGPFQHRGVGDIKPEAGFAQDASCHCRFLPSFFSQVNISPAGEAVFKVPGGLPMAHENDLMHD